MRDRRDHIEQIQFGSIRPARLISLACLLLAITGCGTAVNGPLRFTFDSPQPQPTAREILRLSPTDLADPEATLENSSPPTGVPARRLYYREIALPDLSGDDLKSARDTRLVNIDRSAAETRPAVQTSAFPGSLMDEWGGESIFSPGRLTRAAADHFGDLVACLVQLITTHPLVRGALVLVGTILEPIVSDLAAYCLGDERDETEAAAPVDEPGPAKIEISPRPDSNPLVVVLPRPQAASPDEAVEILTMTRSESVAASAGPDLVN